MRQRFIGELLPQDWLQVKDVFSASLAPVSSRAEAVAAIRAGLQSIGSLASFADDELWFIMRFWSGVGEVFVYRGLVLKDVSVMLELLRPLMHHRPTSMLAVGNEYSALLLPDSRIRHRDAVEECLLDLETHHRLHLSLLPHLAAWSACDGEQRTAMLDFFKRSLLMCSIPQREEVLFLSARTRAAPVAPVFAAEVDDVLRSPSSHVALFLLPLNHIGIIPQLQAKAASLQLSGVFLTSRVGKDAMLLNRSTSSGSPCAVRVDSYATLVGSGSASASTAFGDLDANVGGGRAFGSVLAIACSDYGLFKFMVQCADGAMDSCVFGSRFQCWLRTRSAACRWVRFRHSLPPGSSRPACAVTLTEALRRNMHEPVTLGMSVFTLLSPACPIFISHAWGDGTTEFVRRLKHRLEDETLSSVWTDTEGIDQSLDDIIARFRSALCAANVIVVCLTPHYLTRPNCLRELRWALDFAERGLKRVVLLPLHPAVTFEHMSKVTGGGDAQGLVFCGKGVQRLSKTALDILMGNVFSSQMTMVNDIPSHQLQVTRSLRVHECSPMSLAAGMRSFVFIRRGTATPCGRAFLGACPGRARALASRT